MQKIPRLVRLPRDVVRQLRITQRVADVDFEDVVRSALCWWATLDPQTRLLLVGQHHYRPGLLEPVPRPGFWARLGHGRLAGFLRRIRWW